MTDVPEQILARLATLLGSMSGILGVYRDRGDLLKDMEVGGALVKQLPAALIWQAGSELTMDVSHLKSVRMPPAIYAMRPEIYIICRPRDDATNLTLDGVSNPISAELASWREHVDAAIMNDPTLIGLLTTSGQIVFLGYETDMRNGGELFGMIQLKYEFRYLWTPSRG